jgi:hypothetical protein
VLKKKIILLSIVLFVCCLGITPLITAQPFTGNIVNNPDKVNSYAKKLTNFNPSIVNQKMIIQQGNLTPGELKLSTALLLETTGSSDSSARNQQESGSGLVMKTIPTLGTSKVMNSGPEKVPSGNLVYVYISTQPGYSTHIVDSFVVDVTDRDEDNHLAVGWVDIQKLETLASVEGVRNIREVILPLVNTGSVTTQGDAIHKTANVRSTYGYTGAGMKIGIISDGVDHINESKASGDLPADVVVLSNTNPMNHNVNDEGTAMLEIVHDMVPDADLYFHDSGNNWVAFNDAIHELKANGCTVICDDVYWSTVPFFEDGIIATNLSLLLSGNQIVYVSSAGNSNESHYQGAFYQRAGAPAGNHDFSHGTDPNITQLYLYMPPGGKATVVLEWNDRFGNSSNNYDLALSQYNWSDLGYSNVTQNGGDDPIEYLTYTNSGINEILAQIGVFRQSGDGKTLEIFTYTSNGSYTFLDNLVASDSIYGHPAVPDVIAVGAIRAADPGNDDIEWFSSLGPVSITYPSPVSRQKPDISGIDGVNVTGAGGFSKTFYGTSAAAPHIAAVVAQIWGANKTLTPAQVRTALYTSAVDLGSPGKDTVFGYGRADALAMANITPVTVTNVTMTKIGIYNAGNWYIDYNGDGQFIPATGDRYIPYGAGGWTQLVGDWNGDGKSEIGIFKDGLWYIDYGGSGVIDANTKYYSFGAAGWTPLIGDWNGDKKDEIGVYQDGNWYLDYNGNGVWDTGDKNYGFGTTGWTAVTGKWTSDGYTKIGIYNGGNWYIDYNGDGQFIPATGDRYIPYGASGWTHLVGDWNGDGKSEIGIFKDGLWYIDYGGSGVIDANTKYYSFGGAGWTPLIGDWNADTSDEIGVYNAGNWYLDYDGTGVWSAGDKNYGFGTTGWMPVIGKWT